MFEIYFENVRSVVNKKTDILLSTYSLEYDCIALAETWLHPSQKNEEFIDSKYAVYRKDRIESNIDAQRAGGVLIAIHRKYDSELINLPEFDGIEAICVKVSMRSSTSFVYICNLYIQNRINKEQASTIQRYKDHFQAIRAIKELTKPGDLFVALGDFNMPLVEWTNDNDNGDICDYGFIPILGESISIESNLYRETTNNILELGLSQSCNFANHAGNVLDLVYSICPELISVERAALTLFSDEHRDQAHNPILCSIECEPMKFDSNPESSSRYSFNRADYDGINRDLDALDYELLFQNDDINVSTDSFYEQLFKIIDKHVPQATPKINNHPIWFNKTAINLRNIRNREYKKLQNKRKTSENVNDTLFMDAKTKFDSYQRELYTNYVKQLAQNRNGDSGSFWRFINEKRSSNSLPSKISLNDQSASTDADKANLFANFFASVYIDHNDQTDLRNLIDNRNDHGYNIMNITNETVLYAIKNLNISKGAGFDKIPPSFVKQCAETIAKPLSILYGKSIADCAYPNCWKIGQITPIHKSGKKNDVKNYRGVNVLSTFAKMFETLIYNQLKLVIFPRLSKNQHGFLPNRNITSNLLEFTSSTYAAFDNKSQMDVFYADISKAFDAVNQKLLIKKMAKYPIGNDVLRWFISYFGDRRQCVRVGASISEIFNVPSSVGQGSVLGPILFLIFFDDSDNEITESMVWNFADDKRIAQTIKNPTDSIKLQESINKFMLWCEENGLSVNAMKCKIMTFSLKKITVHTDYYIGNDLIDRADTIRDLGVMLDSKLSFSTHIEFITNKAYAMLAFIKRQCYKTFDVDIAKMLFFAFVRSNLEFANQVWCPDRPNHKKYCDAIESIQKRFIKFITPNNSAQNPDNEYELRPYITRCAENNIETLRRRRINSCIFFLHDVITGRINSVGLRNQISFVKISYFTRSPDFIKINTCRLDCANNSPFRTACRLYNLCALHVDVTLNRDTFRRKIIQLPDSIFGGF